MALVNGTNLVLYVSDGGIDKAFGHSRSFTLNVEANTIDATSRASAGWSEFIMGSRSFTLDFEGLVSYDDDINVEWLQTAVENKTKFLVKFTDNLAGNLIYNGYVYISNLSIESPNEDVVTYSGTLQGTEIFSTTYITPGDPDAQAFIAAAGLTDPTQIDAINGLVEDLKAENLWTKFYAIYPFVGGTATTHKFNLKDPRDLDVAYRLQFNGTWTHASTGVIPSSTNAYGNTFLEDKSLSSFHLSYYSRTSAAAPYFDNVFGAGDLSVPGSEFDVYLKIRDIGGNASTSMNISSADAPNTNGQGFYLGSRNGDLTQKLYKNGAEIASTTSGVSYPGDISMPLYFGSYNANDLASNEFYKTNKECAFASIGTGLTVAEALTFYTIINDFQTALSRQV